MLQSENTKKSKTLAAHQSDQNLIEDRLDHMEVEVEVELISVKPAPTTTSNAVNSTGGNIQERHVSDDVGVVGKCELPPTNSLQSGMPPAAKQCQNDNSSNKNAMLNQRNFSNVTATKLKTVVQNAHIMWLSLNP